MQLKYTAELRRVNGLQILVIHINMSILIMGEAVYGVRFLDVIICCFFSSRRRHTISDRDWSSDVCSSDLTPCSSGIWSSPRSFTPTASHHDLGLLQVPEEQGVLRVLDGQHRLVALHALSQAGENMNIEVPAVLFDSLDARQIVELFVTINAKHTRLNPSHIISLAGRKLYPDANQALAHDVIRSLNEDDTSPLHSEIKMLGTGRGRVSQAPLAEEIVDFFETVEKVGSGGKLQELRGGAKRFFLNYIKALSTTFPAAWAGRKYSIKTGAALPAFIRAAPDVMARARELRRDPFDLNAIREAIKPWGERLRDRRFATQGEGKLKPAGGTRGTVEVLTRELRDALR